MFFRLYLMVEEEKLTLCFVMMIYIPFRGRHILIYNGKTRDNDSLFCYDDIYPFQRKTYFMLLLIMFCIATIDIRLYMGILDYNI